MKALVVWRGWAGLVAAGHKPDENRGWRTSYRGPLLIVAGQRWDPQAVDFAAERGVTISPAPDDHPTGALAVVDLTGMCSAAVDGSPCGCSTWACTGLHHWRLANSRQLARPIPVRGMPGMFTPPVSVREQVCEQLGLCLNTRHTYWPELTDAEGDAFHEMLDDTCGDCITGRCHWGGDGSLASEAAVKADPSAVVTGPHGERCGCARHNTSVLARRFKRQHSDSIAAAIAWHDAKLSGDVVVIHD